MGIGQQLVINGSDGTVRSPAGGSACIMLAQTFRQACSTPFVVRTFEAGDQGEWLVLIFLDPSDGEIRAEIVHPSFRGGHSVDEERAILIV